MLYLLISDWSMQWLLFSDWFESFLTLSQGHSNNIHCLATAINQLLGCLFSLGGHDDIEDRLKEFLALASSSLLRLGQVRTSLWLVDTMLFLSLIGWLTLILISDWSGGSSGGCEEQGECLHSSSSDCWGVSILVDGSPGVLLPLLSSPQLLSLSSQSSSSSSCCHGKQLISTLLCNYQYLFYLMYWCIVELGCNIFVCINVCHVNKLLFLIRSCCRCCWFLTQQSLIVIGGREANESPVDRDPLWNTYERIRCWKICLLELQKKERILLIYMCGLDGDFSMSSKNLCVQRMWRMRTWFGC